MDKFHTYKKKIGLEELEYGAWVQIFIARPHEFICSFHCQLRPNIYIYLTTFYIKRFPHHNLTFIPASGLFAETSKAASGSRKRAQT